MMYEIEDEGNKIDLLYESPTTEPDGVKITVSVNYSDRYEFTKKIKEQLAYFENVFFKVDGINNDFTIVRSEDFQWSSLCNDSQLHICLDNVYYSLDFNKLGIAPIYLPIGLRFSLTDGLFPVPNREMIKYSAEAKKIILDKIAKVVDYFVNKYNETIEETEDVQNIFTYYNSSSRFVEGYDGNDIRINDLIPYSKIKIKDPTLKGVKKLDLKRINTVKDWITSEYEIKYTFYNKRFRSNKRSWKVDSRICRETVYVFTGELDRKKQNYLRTIIPNTHRNIYFVRKDRTIKLGDLVAKYNDGYNNWISILELRNYPKSQWREIIKEAQYIRDLLTKDFIDVDSIEIPKEWFEKKKQERVYVKKERVKKAEGEFKGKLAVNLERYVRGKECKFTPTTFSYTGIEKYNKLSIYCLENNENEEIIQKWYPLLKTKVRFVIFSEREYSKLKLDNIHNWMKLEEFIKGDNKIIQRIVTCYLIEKMEEEYSKLLDYDFLKHINTPLHEDYKCLENYSNKHPYKVFTGSDYKLITSYLDKVDTTIIHIYNKVNKELEKIKFLKVLLENRYGSYLTSPAVISLAKDLLKYRKVRIDWQHYKLNGKLIQEIKETEEGED